MKKIVDVYPYIPITQIKHPIVTNTLNIELSTGDILTCICAKAKVEEVLSDGTRVRLNFSNYDKEIKPVKVEYKPTPDKVVSNKPAGTTQPPKKPETPKEPKPSTPTPEATKPATDKVEVTNKPDLGKKEEAKKN